MPATPLKFHRFFRGLSQQKISEETGLSQCRISRLERGLAPDNPANQKAKASISEFLDIPETILFPNPKKDDGHE